MLMSAEKMPAMMAAFVAKRIFVGLSMIHLSYYPPLTPPRRGIGQCVFVVLYLLFNILSFQVCRNYSPPRRAGGGFPIASYCFPFSIAFIFLPGNFSCTFRNCNTLAGWARNCRDGGSRTGSSA